MSGLLLTIDDASPLIIYQPPGAWAQHNISTDPDTASKSYQKTFSSTQQPGATMTFTFEGVGVFVYGSVDVDHGNFTVDLDGQIIPKDPTDPSVYPFPLFVANHTLPPGTHTFTMSTRGNSTLIIDYLAWISSVNVEKTGSVNESVIDDADPAFQKHQGDWPEPSDVASFYGSTGHSTKEIGATMALAFTLAMGGHQTCLHDFPGDAVALYGSVGPDNGPYSIQLDNGTSESYSATAKTYAPQSLLYYDSNIGPGNHSLLIINQANDLFEIDYAAVYTLPRLVNSTSSPGTANTSGPSPDNTAHSHSSVSAGAIVGITVGAGVAAILVLLICLLFYLKKTKEKWARERDHYTVKPQSTYDYASPLDDSTLVGPFRLHRNSKSTIGSPESPGKSEMRKPYMFTSFVPIIRSPTPRSNASMAASTLVGEDGSNASVSHSSRRPKPRLKHTKSLEPIYTNRIHPEPDPYTQRIDDNYRTMSMRRYLTPTEPISEAREVGSVQHRRRQSHDFSQSSRGATPVQESDYDASSETESMYSTRPGPPPPSPET